MSLVNLDANENLLDMNPAAAISLAKASSAASSYPDEVPLRSALAEFYSLSVENVTVGNGSSEILDLIAQVFLTRQNEAVSSQYAFLLYEEVTRRVGACSLVIPAVEFGHDIAAMIAAVTGRTRIMWIANPNNPTGAFIPPQELFLQLKKVPQHVIVVLDEAYVEYLDADEKTDAAQLLAAFPNLIIVRTFSKAYGLAGLRVGYALASEDISAKLNARKPRFSVNTLGLAAAEAALKDQKFIERCRQGNAEGRAYLERSLRDLGVPYLTCKGNFITCQIGNATARSEKLREAGVAVLPLTLYGLPDYMRITIGGVFENARFMRALTEILCD